MEDTNAKKYILKNIHFPNMKSIFEKYVKKWSFFEVLPFKILHTEKVGFLKTEKNRFLLLESFLEVVWVWKHVQKMRRKIPDFFIKMEFW